MGDSKTAHEALLLLRKLVAMPPPNCVDVQVVIDAELVPTVVNYLMSKNPAKVQKEAAWIVNIITYSRDSEHIQIVVNAGAVPHLLAFISSSDNLLLELVI